jgi:DNA-binding response OmpR family regulator
VSPSGKRILVIERDPAGRALMDRVLGSAELATDAVGSLKDVEDALDHDAYALAIVDELAGTGAMLEEVRAVRRRWPQVPVIVTGTILSARVLVDLMRLGVYEALPKPFLPEELRDAVARCLVRAWPGERVALDFEAAVEAARDALAHLDLPRAELMLRRARGLAPLDAEVVALDALRAELAGDDYDAERWYRAALVLGDDASAAPPDPGEGLARLAAYRGLARADELDREWSLPRAWIVAELRAIDREPEPARPWVLVTTVGLSAAIDAPIHLRASADRAVATSLGAQRPETLAAALDRLALGAIVATDDTRKRLDLDRVETLRKGGT